MAANALNSPRLDLNPDANGFLVFYPWLKTLHLLMAKTTHGLEHENASNNCGPDKLRYCPNNKPQLNTLRHTLDWLIHQDRNTG